MLCGKNFLQNNYTEVICVHEKMEESLRHAPKEEDMISAFYYIFDNSFVILGS